MINRKPINIMLVVFSITLMLALLHHYNTQVEMVNEIQDVQQELLDQRASIATVVKILEEERQEKKVIQQTNESLQQSLQLTKHRKDSIWLELQGTEKALRKARNGGGPPRGSQHGNARRGDARKAHPNGEPSIKLPHDEKVLDTMQYNDTPKLDRFRFKSPGN